MSKKIIMTTVRLLVEPKDWIGGPSYTEALNTLGHIDFHTTEYTTMNGEPMTQRTATVNLLCFEDPAFGMTIQTPNGNQFKWSHCNENAFRQKWSRLRHGNPDGLRVSLYAGSLLGLSHGIDDDKSMYFMRVYVNHWYEAGFDS